MELPEEVKEGIAEEIEAKFDFLFKQLKAVENKKTVDMFIKPVDVQLAFAKGKAVLDGEGDDLIALSLRQKGLYYGKNLL